MGFDHLSYIWTVVFPITVLLYYFFRKRYVSQTLSSTLFWEQSMRETSVSPYLKNLQRNLLFYLQMVALLLLLFALLTPYVKRDQAQESNLVFIVDTSATMLATSEGETLFERHRQKMKELVHGHEDSEFTIITSGKEPTVMIRNEKDPEKLLATLDSLEVTYEQSYLDLVIQFTRSLLSSGSEEIHVFTDSVDRSVLSNEHGSTQWIVHGSSVNYLNVSIDKFGAVRTDEGVEAITKIVNQSEVDLSGELVILDGLTDETLASKRFALEAGKDLLLSVNELPESRALHAKLDVNDEYAPDNDAYVLLGNEMTEAIIDANLHQLVKRVFEAVGLTVTSGTTEEMNREDGKSLLVTNDVSFYHASLNPLILIGRNDKPSKAVSGTIESSNDPLFTVADLKEVFVSEVYPPFENLETIATLDDQPFIQKSARGDIVVLADIENTDWPLHPSFPLFVWSATESLKSEADSLGMFSPNERKSLFVRGSGKEVEVFTAEDEYRSSFSDGSSFIAPSVPGIYKLMDYDTEKLFTVVLEKSEKKLIRGESYKVGSAVEARRTTEGKNRVVWIILLPVLLLLLLEWEVQRRRGYPN